MKVRITLVKTSTTLADFCNYHEPILPRGIEAVLLTEGPFKFDLSDPVKPEGTIVFTAASGQCKEFTALFIWLKSLNYQNCWRVQNLFYFRCHLLCFIASISLAR